MPQLNLYLSKELAEEVRRRADARGLGVSAYLAEVVKVSLQEEDWPRGFWDEIGWAGGEMIERPDQVDFPAREPML